jgi:hypothetical protein
MLGELGFVEIIGSDFHHFFLKLDHIIYGFFVHHFDSVLIKDANFGLEHFAWRFFENKTVFVSRNWAGLSSPG